MYRSEQTALLERIESANQRVENVRFASERLLSQLAELDQQLLARGLFTTEPPVMTQPEPAAYDASMSPDELDRLAATQEAEVERYEGELRALQRLLRVQQSRLEGRPEPLPLGSAPRDVPRGYLWSEWFTPVLSIGLCFGIVVLFGGTMAPVAGLPIWLFGTVAILYLLYRTRKSAKERVEFLRRCRVLDGVRIGEFEHTTASLSEPFGGVEATGWDIRRAASDGGTGYNTLYFSDANGHQREFRYRGAPYRDGVVLHDDSTGKTYCVSQFACRPRPDIYGRWVAHTTVAAKLGIGLSILALFLWFGAGLVGLVVTLLTCGSFFLPFAAIG